MRPVPSFEPAAAPACPKHAGVPSVAPCARCGTFLCDSCLVLRDPPMCESCSAIAHDPLGVRARTFGIGASISGGWKMFRAAFPTVALVAVIFAIPSGLISYALEDADGNFGRITNLYDATIGLIGLIAVLWAMAAAAEGRRITAGQALSYGVGSWGRVFAARFRTGLWVVLFTLLLIVPGVIKALALLMVTPMAVLDRDGDPLQASTELTAGSKGELFLLCIAGGVVAFGAIMPIAVAIGAMTELVPGLGAPMAVMLDLVARIATYLFEGMAFAAYYGLMRKKQLEAAHIGQPVSL